MTAARTFFDAVREDTGSHFLDSGNAYGRHHEQPPVELAEPAVTWDKRWMDCSATIETAHFLTQAFEIRDDLNAEFDVMSTEDDESSWFVLGDAFMLGQGYHQHARDNVYNVENDLSQVYIWEVWTRNEDEANWVYADDAVVVLYVHTGCDVRGGYSRPYFAETNGEYTVPFDLCAGYHVEAGRDEDGDPLSDDDCRRIDFTWQCGYSYPMGQVEEQVKRWFPYLSGADSRVALLESGEIVKIRAAMPWVG